MAPVLAPLISVLSRAGIDVAVVPASMRAPGTVLYAVVCDGEFGGRRYVAGEILVCSGIVERAVAVLAPRGPGRPMLGRVESERLFGDAGEPCSAERWVVAGAVERVLLASPQVADACVRYGRSVSVSGSRPYSLAGSAARAPLANGLPMVRAARATAAGVGTPRPSPAPVSGTAPQGRPAAGQLALFRAA